MIHRTGGTTATEPANATINSNTTDDGDTDADSRLIDGVHIRSPPPGTAIDRD